MEARHKSQQRIVDYGEPETRQGVVGDAGPSSADPNVQSIQRDGDSLREEVKEIRLSQQRIEEKLHYLLSLQHGSWKT